MKLLSKRFQMPYKDIKGKTHELDFILYAEDKDAKQFDFFFSILLSLNKNLGYDVKIIDAKELVKENN